MDHYRTLGVNKTISAEDLRTAYRLLARKYHPDQNPGNKVAEEKFKLIAIAYGVLSDPALRDRYDRLGSAAPIVIPSKRGKYTVQSHLCTGDLADVYRARRESDGRSVVLKVARSAAVNDLLAAEGVRLKELFPVATDAKAPGVRYLPKFHDSFQVDDGTRRRVTVLDDLAEYATFEKIRELFPVGVPLEHGVWMFNRLLEGLDYIHGKGQVHGALVPSHAMAWMDPKGHLVKIIDWGYAGKIGEKVKAVSPKWRSFYPSEVYAKNGATQATDIAMAAKLALYILGADPYTFVCPATVPKYLSRFLEGCCLVDQGRRPQEAWALHEEFSAYMKTHYGPKKFVLFNNPAWPA